MEEREINQINELIQCQMVEIMEDLLYPGQFPGRDILGMSSAINKIGGGCAIAWLH